MSPEEEKITMVVGFKRCVNDIIADEFPVECFKNGVVEALKQVREDHGAPKQNV